MSEMEEFVGVYVPEAEYLTFEEAVELAKVRDEQAAYDLAASAETEEA